MNTFYTVVDLAQFGSKMSYKLPGPTPIFVITGFTVHRLALNILIIILDRRNEWKYGNNIICFYKSNRTIILYLHQDKRWGHCRYKLSQPELYWGQRKVVCVVTVAPSQ